MIVLARDWVDHLDVAVEPDELVVGEKNPVRMLGDEILRGGGDLAEIVAHGLVHR